MRQSQFPRVGAHRLLPSVLSGVVLTLLSLSLLPGSMDAAHANAGPPRDAQGRAQKYINHLVRFDDLNKYAKDYRFYVVARPKEYNTITAIAPDKNGEIHYNNFSTLSLKNGAFLYAVPRSLELKPDGEPDSTWFSDATPGVLRSAKLENAIRLNPMSDPHDMYRTRYKVVIKDTPATKTAPAGKSLQIALISNGWEEPKVGLLLGLPIIALFALAGRLRSRPQEKE
jgi:hypothetical protein